ncbi:potassium channel family protein [Haloplanus aerogenes]|uniref:Trk system potassium uptake protein TrkA n=1 Tax=Haloplanus aerogenes TaxID=660522 RepID=A0A3M0CXA3_9EURY|nr:TrkA family potassium uptake protein [Haloplanus aerogenes]AZH25005.1 TrkA family potassium uptake protein [Haloplanus aerogenes]RMB13778.1 trk system potassium uptake protein TrkA [Haloplanus aerogenes]
MTLDIIIAGGGRVGFETAVLLDDRGHDVTVVEPDAARCDDLADEYMATIIRGDASDPDILRQADVARSDVIAGVTGEPGLNLAICMEAKEMNAEIRTVARIGNRNQEGYGQFVDETVFPEGAGARVAANEIEGSDVRTLADVTGTLDIMEIRVQEGAPAAGKALQSVRFPAGTLVISDDDGERVARPETTLTPGKRYVIAVEPDVADEVMNLLRG